jgi:transketolase
MRKEFATTLKCIGANQENLIFLTGDLGFMALEEVQEAMGKRFVNVGVSEQNMISMAAAMAAENLQVVCYSIAPFAVFRPAEQIRLDVCLHNKNVKIVGNGGGYGYGIMGATHHALEDIAVLSAFQNIHCYIPLCNEDVELAVTCMLSHDFPSYLRLGLGSLPQNWKLPEFSPIRNLKKGNALTIIGMGSVLLNVASATEGEIGDVFAVSEMPLLDLSGELKESIKRTGKVLVIEEHVQRGGLGEHLAWQLLRAGIQCRFYHCFARGYQNGLYGSQKYHWQQSGLDSDSLRETIIQINNE